MHSHDVIIIVISSVFLCVSLTHARLSSLATDRFPPTDNNLLTTPPTLKSLASHADLGPKGAFRLKTGQFYPTASGGKRARLVQTYAGYEVYGSSVVAEADSDGVFTGQLYGDISKTLKWQIRNPERCKRNVNTLQNIAIRVAGFKPSDPKIKNRDGRRVIFATPVKRATMAYRIEFFYGNEEVVKWPVYFMEACTGLILLSYDNIRNDTQHHHFRNNNNTQGHVNELGRTNPSSIQKQAASSSSSLTAAGFCSPFINGRGGNPKTGRRTYNIEPNCLSMARSGVTCRMLGNYVKVVDNQGSTNYYNQDIVTFPCLIGYQDGVNEAYGVANDAMFYGEASGRFFEDKYNIRALPYIPRMVVHYGVGFDNAFWDGTDMYFGDGRSFFYPLVALDVIAHELAHGITTRNSDLIYRGQSGGINEAFSDITGEVTKHFVFGSNDWEVGSTIYKGEGALRYFSDPTRDGRSIKYSWLYRVGMDVHFSSGVFNYAFYHMVKSEGMDIYEAYKCFLDANLNLWGPNTNYFTGGCNVMQAAYDNGFNHRKVRRSFFRVGIPLLFCNYWRFRASLRTGERRTNVLVKDTRAPIFKIDTAANTIVKPSKVKVTTEDQSSVTVVVATDKDAENVIATGENEATFDPDQKDIFIKLISDQPADVKTTVEVI